MQSRNRQDGRQGKEVRERVREWKEVEDVFANSAWRERTLLTSIYVDTSIDLYASPFNSPRLCSSSVRAGRFSSQAARTNSAVA